MDSNSTECKVTCAYSDCTISDNQTRVFVFIKFQRSIHFDNTSFQMFNEVIKYRLSIESARSRLHRMFASIMQSINGSVRGHDSHLQISGRYLPVITAGGLSHCPRAAISNERNCN